jgi:hypothetical protein
VQENSSHQIQKVALEAIRNVLQLSEVSGANPTVYAKECGELGLWDSLWAIVHLNDDDTQVFYMLSAWRIFELDQSMINL